MKKLVNALLWLAGRTGTKYNDRVMTMKAFRTPFGMEVDVIFEEPEKAEAYFIKGDCWKSVFWTIFDLADLAEHISYRFHNESTQWDKDLESYTTFLEGFGKFVKSDDGTWRTRPPRTNRSSVILSVNEQEAGSG